MKGLSLMTPIPSGQANVVRVKPQPNIYTLLLILAIVFLAVTVGLVIYNLMTTYGMTFGEVFYRSKSPEMTLVAWRDFGVACS